MKRADIMYITDVSFDKVGGAQESTRILAQGLSDRYRIVAISPKSSSIGSFHHIVDEFPTFSLRNASKLEFLRITWRLARLLFRYRPRILHLQMSSTMIMCRFLKLIGLFPLRTRIVLTDRGLYGKASRITTWAVNGLIRTSTFVVTTTEKNRKNYAGQYRHFARYSHRFKVIPNTAGPDYENFDDEAASATRRELDISSQAAVLGFCGRFSAEKNWPLARDIIKGYLESDPHAEAIAMLGTDRTPSRVNSAQEYLDDLRHRFPGRFHGFVDLSPAEVSRLYYAIDFFILTSKREPFGRTAIEAMARKTIVLATPVDGLPEVIGDVRYQFETAEEAVRLIQQYRLNEAQSQEAIRYFYDRYHKKYSVESNLEQYENLYLAVLETSR